VSFAVLSVRPKVAELVLQLYGRSIHPELFDIHETRTFQRGKYEASVRITSTGHLVAWKVGDLLLTEVATSAHLEMPEKRRLMSHRVRASREDRLECHGGITYEMSFSLETASSEKLRAYQKELSLQAARNGILHQFEASGRFEAGGISYMNVESRDKSFRVQAFHTFPDDSAVLRIQSMFRLP
jgi:hypothetical protein